MMKDSRIFAGAAVGQRLCNGSNTDQWVRGPRNKDEALISAEDWTSQRPSGYFSWMNTLDVMHGSLILPARVWFRNLGLRRTVI